MRKESIRRIAFSSLTIGGALLAICGVSSQLSTLIQVPQFTFTILLIAGISLIVVSLPTLFFLGIPKFRRRKLTTYEAVMAERGDLEELHEFFEKYAGPHFATLESWRKRHDKHPGTFF